MKRFFYSPLFANVKFFVARYYFWLATTAAVVVSLIT